MWFIFRTSLLFTHFFTRICASFCSYLVGIYSDSISVFITRTLLLSVVFCAVYLSVCGQRTTVLNILHHHKNTNTDKLFCYCSRLILIVRFPRNTVLHWLQCKPHNVQRSPDTRLHYLFTLLDFYHHPYTRSHCMLVSHAYFLVFCCTASLLLELFRITVTINTYTV